MCLMSDLSQCICLHISINWTFLGYIELSVFGHSLLCVHCVLERYSLSRMHHKKSIIPRERGAAPFLTGPSSKKDILRSFKILPSIRLSFFVSVTGYWVDFNSFFWEPSRYAISHLVRLRFGLSLGAFLL